MPSPPPQTQPRTYAAAHFGLELDGVDQVGIFRSIEGGGVKTDVMTYQNGSNYDRWRQLGKPKYDDIKLQVGMAMSQPFYTWIKNFFDGVPDRRNGAIVAADFYYSERARRTFSNAMIKELTFPKLDGADKAAAYMSIGVAVEDIVFAKGTGKKITTVTGFNNQKLWTACNFRFSLDGFPNQTKRVSKIDSFTVKQNVIEYHCGGHRAPIKTPSQIDYPPISFYIPESDAQPFLDHFNDRAMAVKTTLPGRLTGSIVTYDNDGSPLFTVAFSGADISAVTPDKADAASEEIKHVKVDLYTEKMTFDYAAMEVL
jgi:phage tail-like protein